MSGKGKSKITRDASSSSSGGAVSALAVDTSTSASLATDPLPVTKVNKVNLAEIKAALDEIVKHHLAEQSFKPSLLHPTVHLSLGYASIIFSLGGSLYTYRMSFEESKPVMLVAVVAYFTLQTLLWAWKRWVEKGEVFRGKRRRVVKRVETDHVQVTSTTTLTPPPAPQLSFSPHIRPSSPTASSPRSLASDTIPPSSPSVLNLSHSRDTSGTSGTSASAPSGASSPTSPSSPSSCGPTYMLHLTLSTTSNNGKSLLHKARLVSGRGVGEFVDEQGGVEEGEVTRWLAGLLGDAGLVGAEDAGVKNE